MSNTFDPTNPAESSTADPPTRPASSGSGLANAIRTCVSWLPSLIVVIALAGVAWYGHENEWKLPAIGATNASLSAGDARWCESHGVAEADCIVCKPTLIEDVAELVFCREHGVHGCVLCNPVIAETKQRTEPTAADLERAQRALALRPRIENLAIGSSPGRSNSIRFDRCDEQSRRRRRTC